MLTPVTGKPYSFQSWFFDDHHDVYEQSFNPKQPLLYEINGCKHVNLFKGYQYCNKPVEPFSRETLQGVKFIWDHVEKVLCSSNKETFKYLQQWICNMFTRKMKTVPVFKALQGTGKSCFTDFIKNVVGSSNVLVTSEPELVLGSFNESIKTALLVIFEEMPCASSNEWMSVSNKLKEFITGPNIVIKEKYKNSFTLTNFISLMICSNNECVKIDSDDRRYFPLDVSNHKKYDYEYFNTLFKYTTDVDVQCAFYWTSLDLVDKKFNESVMPMTTNKHDLIVDNMHSLYAFIKEKYVLKLQGINIKFKQLYEQYAEYCENHKIKVISAIAMSRKLSDYNITVENRAQNIKYVVIHKDKLLELYKKIGWIHGLDEFNEEGNEQADTIDEDIEYGVFGDEFEKTEETPIKKSKKKMTELDEGLLNAF